MTTTNSNEMIRRRWFFEECGLGIAGLAFNSLLQREGISGAQAESKRQSAPHFQAKAKRVIYMFQAGAPSQFELFDHKPELAKRSGELPPAELLKGYRSAFINPSATLLGPKYEFKKKFGQSGMDFSELVPHMAERADDWCVIHSMQTEAVNHAPGQIMMNTGSQQFGRPSFGSWTLYGLGSVCENLPGYVVLTSAKGTSAGASNYGCGFLPTEYAGTPFRSTGDPILYLSNPKGIDIETHRASLDALNELNGIAVQRYQDPETLARIQSYEMAFHLQSSAPELMDLSREPQSILDMYGIKDINEASYARNCLLARRLAERDVRFVQLFHEVWDTHSGLTKRLKENCKATDQASAALVADLEQRGLLDDTIVIWGGEFGRTPMVQGGDDGRDHHNRAFTMCLAGGGLKRGYSHGETDEIGFNVVRDPVHVHDLHATLLHLLGLDHERLTYRFQGRDFRLTDVHGRIVNEIIA